MPLEWLIDLMKEWVQAQGFLTTSFVGLGQFDGAVFIDGLVLDGLFHEIDVSQDLPVTGVKAVNVHITGKTANAGDVLYIRPTYDDFPKSTCALRPAVANITDGERRTIGLAPDYKLEYSFIGAGWTDYKIHIRGYWL